MNEPTVITLDFTPPTEPGFYVVRHLGIDFGMSVFQKDDKLFAGLPGAAMCVQWLASDGAKFSGRIVIADAALAAAKGKV